MLANIDNDRALDIDTNWSKVGKTCHMKVKQNFLQELKEAGIVEYNWLSMVSNE